MKRWFARIRRLGALRKVSQDFGNGSDRQHRLRPWAGALVLVGVWLLISAGQINAQTGPDLTIWLTPTDAEYFPNARPTQADIRSFLNDLPRFLATRTGESISPNIRVDPEMVGKMTLDPAFARQVLGQRQIFKSLSEFLKAGSETPATITVRFFDWEELLAVLETVPQQASEQADILMVPSSWVAHLAERRVLAPLGLIDGRQYLSGPLETCAVRLSPNRGLFTGSFSWLLRPFGEFGEREYYALPWSVDLRFFFYWKDRFEDANFRDIKSFETALAASTSSRDGVFIPPFALPAAADWDLLHYFSLLLWGQGDDWQIHPWFGDFLDRSASIRVANRLQDWKRRELVAYPRIVRSELETVFLNKEVSSLVAGPWMFHRLRERLGPSWPSAVGVSLPPFNVESKPVTFLGGLHLGLTPRGAKQRAARAALRYLTTDASDPWGASLLTIPGSRSGLAALKRSIFSDSIDRVIDLGLTNARSYPAVPEWARSVEADATRNDLLALFKHVAEDGAPVRALADAEALSARTTAEVIGRPRNTALALGFALILGAATAVGFRRYRRSQRRRRREREQRTRLIESKIRGEQDILHLAVDQLVRAADKDERTEAAHQIATSVGNIATELLQNDDIDLQREVAEQIGEVLAQTPSESNEVRRDVDSNDLTRPSSHQPGTPIEQIPRRRPFLFPALADILEDAAHHLEIREPLERQSPPRAEDSF